MYARARACDRGWDNVKGFSDYRSTLICQTVDGLQHYCYLLLSILIAFVNRCLREIFSTRTPSIIGINPRYSKICISNAIADPWYASPISRYFLRLY